MIRRFVAAVLVLVATGAVGPASPVARAQSWYDGPCLDHTGVTVVVDFQELGGGVNVRCAPGPVRSGLGALDAAGVSWGGTLRFADFVCRIAGQPGAASEPCGNTPPATAYWGYWLAPRGGNWCYSILGPANRTPPAGTVEGWSFALNRTGADLPPPRFAPPAPIAGQAPMPLNPSDCGTATAPTTLPAQPPTTDPPPTPPTPAPPAPPPPAASPTATPPAAPATTAAPPRPGGPAPAADPSDTGPAPLVPEPTTTSSQAAPDTTESVEATTSLLRSTTTDIDEDDETRPRVASAVDDGPLALGTVDLGDDGRSSGGFGAGTALGLVLVVVLAATGAIVTVRRRRPS